MFGHPKRIYVKWLDASYEEGSISYDQISGKGCTLESVGFLAKETEQCICISLEYSLDDRSFRHVTNIPKKYILKRSFI